MGFLFSMVVSFVMVNLIMCKIGIQLARNGMRHDETSKATEIHGGFHLFCFSGA